jgi:hypothetical protein
MCLKSQDEQQKFSFQSFIRALRRSHRLCLVLFTCKNLSTQKGIIGAAMNDGDG